MAEFRVVIPDEKYTVIEFIQDEFPGVALINRALQNFEPKRIFGWHLSLMINLEDLLENGMPSYHERDVIDEFEQWFSSSLKGADPKSQTLCF